MTATGRGVSGLSAEFEDLLVAGKRQIDQHRIHWQGGSRRRRGGRRRHAHGRNRVHRGQQRLEGPCDVGSWATTITRNGVDDDWGVMPDDSGKSRARLEPWATACSRVQIAGLNVVGRVKYQCATRDRSVGASTGSVGIFQLRIADCGLRIGLRGLGITRIEIRQQELGDRAACRGARVDGAAGGNPEHAQALRRRRAGRPRKVRPWRARWSCSPSPRSRGAQASIAQSRRRTWSSRVKGRARVGREPGGVADRRIRRIEIHQVAGARRAQGRLERRQLQGHTGGAKRRGDGRQVRRIADARPDIAATGTLNCPDAFRRNSPLNPVRFK